MFLGMFIAVLAAQAEEGEGDALDLARSDITLDDTGVTLDDLTA